MGLISRVSSRTYSVLKMDRLERRKQNPEDAYAQPANFLEIDVHNPITHGVGNLRFTEYTVSTRTNLPCFKQRECTVKRRYSDLEWLRNELQRDVKLIIPPMPGKSLMRQMPFRNDDGIFEDKFIEKRRQALEQFINKLAGHPLAQNERILHMFLLDDNLDKEYNSYMRNGSRNY